VGKITQSRPVAVSAAVLSLAVLYGAWFGFTVARRRHAAGARPGRDGGAIVAPRRERHRPAHARHGVRTRWRGDAVRPMLASLEPAPLVDEAFVYEPKYDGIRALIEIEPGRDPAGVSIVSRLGNDKTAPVPRDRRAPRSRSASP
jgi:ATP-dependent DNA ligase